MCFRRHVGVVEDMRHHVCDFLGCLLRTLLCTCQRLAPCTRFCYSLLHALQRVLRPHISLQVSVCRPHGCLGDMAIWHGVVMLVASEVYAAVGGHLEIRIRDYLKVCCRQRLQVGTVDGKEEFLAACTHVCEDGRG